MNIVSTAEANMPYQIIAQYYEKAKEQSYLPIPPNLDPRLMQYLILRLKTSKLYKHQALALEKILKGENVVLSTSTASGKSLAFYIPVIQKLLEDQTATSLFLFPQKALAADQEKKLREFVAPFRWPQNFVGRYDGTVTGTELRKQIITDSRMLVATPDVLHTTILRCSGEEEYRHFFQRLSYVILDECHLYDGVFGTNMAFLLRRLRQVMDWEGAKPQFIAASATIEDPQTHLEKLTGLPFYNFGQEADGSGNNGRHYRFLKPIADETMFDVVYRCVQEALGRGEKTLIFLDSRQGVENLNGYLRQRLGERGSLCAPYRAGFTAIERGIIESKLNSGEIRCVISTSAMELGIDVSGLQRCILCGIPADRTSFFQRIGRVGRGLGGHRGKVDIIFGNTTVDEYYFRYPHLIWEGRFNPSYLNFNNERLLSDHGACASFEAELVEGRELKKSILGPLFGACGQKHQTRSFAYCHSTISNPHFDLNLRMISDPTYKIITGRDVELGTINLSQILREAYQGAIYKHNGKRYEVTQITPGKVFVKPFFEKGVSVKPLGCISTKRRFNAPDASTTITKGASQVKISSTWFNVRHIVLGYTKTTEEETTQHLYNHSPVSNFMVTQGFELNLKRQEGFTQPGARALANAIFKATPLVAGINMGDLTHDVIFPKGECQIRILDDAEGGLGLAWKLAGQLVEIVREAEILLSSCSNCVDRDASGCVLCSYMPADSSDLSIDRRGGIELARWLSDLLDKGTVKTKAQDEKSEARKEARRNTGFVLSPGSTVFITGIYKVGKVISSRIESKAERLYTIEVDNEKRNFYASKLELIEGDVGLWCLSCNTDNLSFAAQVCPVCGMALACDKDHLLKKEQTDRS